MLKETGLELKVNALISKEKVVEGKRISPWQQILRLTWARNQPTNIQDILLSYNIYFILNSVMKYFYESVIRTEPP
jgi:hypothetical protein